MSNAPHMIITIQCILCLHHEKHNAKHIKHSKTKILEKEKGDYEKRELEGCSPRNLHSRTITKIHIMSIKLHRTIQKREL